MIEIISNVQLFPVVNVENFISIAQEKLRTSAYTMIERNKEAMTISRFSISEYILNQTTVNSMPHIQDWAKRKSPKFFGRVLIIEYYSSIRTRPKNFGYDLFKQALRNCGSTTWYNKNDILTLNNEKIAGYIFTGFTHFIYELFIVNFDIKETLQEFLPITEYHRPFGNIDVNINKVLTEYLKLLSSYEKLDILDVHAYYKLK